LFDQLFSPIQLGRTIVRNRIVSSANYSGLGENNLPSERLAEYHAEKARGGIGITIVEELPVSATSKFSHERSIYAFDKKCVPGFRLLTSKVHEYGALTLGQFMHVGLNTTGFDPWGIETKLTIGPSTIPSIASPDGYSVAQEMSTNQIEKEASNYALAATNLLDAGFDGVEIKSDAGALPMQFLSPITNKRTDEYGGSLDNRMKFLDLVIDEIYGVTNGSKILGIKLVSNEFVEGGLSKADVKEIAKHIDSFGKVDYTAASGNPGIDPDYNTPSAYYPQAVFVDLAENIKSSVSPRLKVMTLGRITDPSVAEGIIAANQADFVIMMRAIIADPELPRKAREGRVSEIIPCIGCNNCLHRVLSGRPTGCLLNPVTAREKQWGIGTIQKAEKKRSILIIGAGPAGIECARIAAMRGHDVTIYEKGLSIGGQTKIAEKIPPLAELKKAIEFWEAEIQRLGISIRLNHNATLADIEMEGPEVIVLATGGIYSRKGFSPAFASPPDGYEILRDISELATRKPGNDSFDNHIVIYDDRGDIQGLGWAELALDQGGIVTFLTRNPTPAMYAPDWSLHTALKRLLPRKLKIETNVYLKKIEQTRVTFVHLYTQEEKTIDSNQTYYLSWPEPENKL
jgi:2,4-dienoyl-CoA reductase-like NADH-dependent reductase (Old Yellow Enzyme family)